MSFDPMNIKKDFPIFKNNNLIYLDNASTTQKPKQVINSMVEFYENYNANVHRGVYGIAEKATLVYEKSRTIIANFINANNEEIIFTKGTTESINIIANAISKDLQTGDEIIISEMEHHSNIVPWLMLSKYKNIKIKYISMLNDGTLNISELKKIISKKTKLISVTHMSNVIGTINPIKEIIDLAHQNNIKVLIDAAQSISHIKIDVKKLKCDYLVFSGHKIMGPTGVGILFGKNNLLKKIPPLLGGGHMIKEVTLQKFSYNDIPWKFEAGTANIAQAIGLGEAIKYLQKFEYNDLHSHTKKITNYLIEKINKVPNIILYPENRKLIGPVISFSIKNIHSYDLTKLLDTQGICIRSGHHCAQPLLNKFKLESLNRVSLYFYNTIDDINMFYDKLIYVIKLLN